MGKKHDSSCKITEHGYCSDHRQQTKMATGHVIKIQTVAESGHATCSGQSFADDT